MIKINLLPPYIFERQIVQRFMMGFAALLVLIIIAGVAVKSQRSAALADLQQQLVITQAKENQVKSNQAQAASERSKIGPITNKVKFIDAVMAHNLEGPALYEQLTRFTYEKVSYKSINLTDNQMEIEAYAPSLSDAGRYLLNLYQAKDLFSQVTMSSVPGYTPASGGGQSIVSRVQIARGRVTVAPAKPKGFDFKVTCVLAHPLSVPAYGGATASSTGSAGAASGAAGPPPPAGGAPPAGGGAPPAGGAAPMPMRPT